MANYKNPMNIIEALLQLRNDLKLWVANNLRVKMDKEDALFYTIDETVEITVE